MTALDRTPSTRVLRQFATVAAIVLIGAAFVTDLRGGRSVNVALFVAFAIVLGVSGWLRPGMLRLPYVVLSLLTLPIGAVISELVLLALFVGVITPLGVVARMLRPDPLRARQDRRARSYWEPRSARTDAASYLRQA